MKIKLLIQYTLLLMLTINRIFPFDKISIIVLDALNSHKLRSLNPKYLFLIILIFLDLSISFTLNIESASLKIFYPLLFLLGAIFLSTENTDVKRISFFFLPNIFAGIIGVLYSSFSSFEPNIFVIVTWGKDFLFPMCATGFSPTPQVYGTFCILYIWACLEKNKIDFGMIISIVGILLSQNRTSYIFLILLLAIYKKKWAVLLAVCLIPLLLINKDILSELVSSKNLDSRSQLRHGFELQYWRSNDMSVYLSGIGNNELAPQFSRFNMDGRPYIENGLDFVLAISGINGLILFVTIVAFFVLDLLKKKKIKICMVFIFYIFINQWMTQEFLASSFFFFMLFILVLSKRRDKIFVSC